MVSPGMERVKVTASSGCVSSAGGVVDPTPEQVGSKGGAPCVTTLTIERAAAPVDFLKSVVDQKVPPPARA